METPIEALRRKKRSRKNKKKHQKKQIEGVCAIKDAPQTTERIKKAQSSSSQELSMPIKEPTANKTVEGERSWKDLLPDLVFNILEKLSYVDRLSATCAIPIWYRSVRKSLGPCLISFANDNKTCTLIDTLHNFEETVPCSNLPSDISILYSKHGWLLLKEQVDDMTCSIFFYNPMSTAIIKLPPFSYPSFFHFAFSAPPDSTDCVIISSFFWEDYGKKIVICKKGDDEWTLMEGDEEIDLLENYEKFETNHMSPVFHKGRFYWIGKDGRVGEFDLHTKSWRVYGKDMRLWPSTFRFYLVESDNDLFLVWSTLEGSTIRTYKLDLDNNKDIWKETYNLGGRCLFVGPRASLSLNTRVLPCKEDKIYFQMLQDDERKQFVFYSGKGRKLHTNGSFFGCSERVFNSCWIEPQWAKPKFQELCWF